LSLNRIITYGMGTTRIRPQRAGMVTTGFAGSLLVVIICNHIITRGMGTSHISGEAGLVTRGYGCAVPIVVVEAPPVSEVVRKIAGNGRRDKRRREEEEKRRIIVHANLIEINGELAKQSIRDIVSMFITDETIKTKVDFVSMKTNELREDIKVDVQIFKKRK